MRSVETGLPGSVAASGLNPEGGGGGFAAYDDRVISKRKPFEFTAGTAPAIKESSK